MGTERGAIYGCRGCTGHWGGLSLVDIASLPSLLAAVLVQAAKIIVSVSKGVAQWRKGLKTNGGAKKSKKNNGAGVAEDEQVRWHYLFLLGYSAAVNCRITSRR